MSIYTHTIYSSIKKEWNNAIFSMIEIIILSQKEKTNTIWYHLYVKSKIWHKWTYLQKRNGLTNTKNRLVVTGGNRDVEGTIGSVGLANANYCI